jgi:transketolase
VPTVRITHTAENLSAKGAYELVGDANAKLTFLATGSEVGLAVEARALLAKDGIASRIVSMPCWALFEEQSPQYREKLLGPGTVKVAIEAGVRQGWDRYIGADGAFVGMHSFGASGPAKDVYKHFHITPEAAAEAAKTALSKR